MMEIHSSIALILASGIAPVRMCGVLVPPCLNWLTDKCSLASLGSRKLVVDRKLMMYYQDYVWYLDMFFFHDTFCKPFHTLELGSVKQLRKLFQWQSARLLDLDSSQGRLQQQAALCSLAQSMEQQSLCFK